MEKNNILPLYHVDEINFPFIEGSFIGKSGKVIEGFFLIDTGSTHNIFNFRAQHTLDESSYLSGKQNVTAVDNKGEECPLINLNIQVGNIECEEHFCVSQNVDFRQYFGKNRIIGVLGVNFLMKYGLVLDFEQKCLRTSDMQPVCLEDKSFIFGMNYGLNSYGIPIVGLINKDKVYLCIVDSGSNMNVLTQLALENATQNIQSTDEEGSLGGLFGEIDSSISQAEFCLVSSVSSKEMNILKDKSFFQVLAGRQYIASMEDNKTQVIDGLLGTEYLLQRKWVLDFGLHIMYSRSDYEKIEHR